LSPVTAAGPSSTYTKFPIKLKNTRYGIFEVPELLILGWLTFPEHYVKKLGVSNLAAGSMEPDIFDAKYAEGAYLG